MAIGSRVAICFILLLGLAACRGSGSGAKLVETLAYCTDFYVENASNYEVEVEVEENNWGPGVNEYETVIPVGERVKIGSACGHEGSPFPSEHFRDFTIFAGSDGQQGVILGVENKDWILEQAEGSGYASRALVVRDGDFSSVRTDEPSAYCTDFFIENASNYTLEVGESSWAPGVEEYKAVISMGELAKISSACSDEGHPLPSEHFTDFTLFATFHWEAHFSVYTVHSGADTDWTFEAQGSDYAARVRVIGDSDLLDLYEVGHLALCTDFYIENASNYEIEVEESNYSGVGPGIEEYETVIPVGERVKIGSGCDGGSHPFVSEYFTDFTIFASVNGEREVIYSGTENADWTFEQPGEGEHASRVLLVEDK